MKESQSRSSNKYTEEGEQPKRSATPIKKDAKRRSLQHSISKCFGNIFQCQVRKVLCQVSADQKSLSFGPINAWQTAEKFKQKVMKEISEYEDKERTGINDMRVPKSFSKNLLQKMCLVGDMQGDIDVVLQKTENETYEQFHSKIKKEIEKIKEKSKSQDIWFIEDYLGLNSQDWRKKNNVKYIFEVKRNMFSRNQIQQQEKKGYRQEKKCNNPKKEHRKKQRELLWKTGKKKEQKSKNQSKVEEVEKSVTKIELQEKNQHECDTNASQTTDKLSKQDLLKKIVQEQVQHKITSQHILNTNVIKNLLQLLKISFFSSYFLQNNYACLSPSQAPAPVSFYLVINNRVKLNQFSEKFDFLKIILKCWFKELGAIMHVIGYNKLSQNEINSKEKEKDLNQTTQFDQMKLKVKLMEKQMGQMKRRAENQRKQFDQMKQRIQLMEDLYSKLKQKDEQKQSKQ